VMCALWRITIGGTNLFSPLAVLIYYHDTSG
jgi:hypothetical protein